MGEVERLIRAASVEVAAEPPDSADARRCLDAYFGELAARFEGGFDAGKDDSARADDMTPPSGLFVIARLDGDAIGCGGLKRGTRRQERSNGSGPRRRPAAMGVARRVLRALEAAARDMGLRTLRLGTNRALTEAHALYRKEGFREIARFNDNPYEHHWFEKRL